MSRRVLLVLALLIGVLPAGVGSLAAQERAGARRSVIVVLSPRADALRVAREAGVDPTYVYTEVINGFAADLPDAAIRALERVPAVELISPDRPVEATAQTAPTGIKRIGATESTWADINRDGGAIDADLAVLDTGIADHPDMKIAGGKNCVGTKGYADGNGHGTHVAGTVAGRDNTLGVVGVAPAARLWAVKVLRSDGGGTWSSVICGLDWVAARANTIDVVNMSLSGYDPSADTSTCADDALHQAICNVVNMAQIPVVAAGNDTDNARSYAPAA